MWYYSFNFDGDNYYYANGDADADGWWMMALLLMAMVITVVVVRSNFRIHCHGKDICVYRSFWQPWWWWKCPYHHNFVPQKTDSDVWSRCIPQFHMHNHACFALGQRWGCKEIKNSVISGNVVILRINHPEYCHEWLVKQPKYPQMPG